jgi:hypothetical protein
MATAPMTNAAKGARMGFFDMAAFISGLIRRS